MALIIKLSLTRIITWKGSYISMHINGIYYCAAADYLVAICAEQWGKEKSHHTHDDTHMMTHGDETMR